MIKHGRLLRLLASLLTPIIIGCAFLLVTEGPLLASDGGSTLRVAQLAQPPDSTSTPQHASANKHKKKHQEVEQTGAVDGGAASTEKGSLKAIFQIVMALLPLILIVGGGIGFLWFRARSGPKISADGHVEADYTIPHCNFETTPEGFKVSFRKLPSLVSTSLAQSNANAQGGKGGFAIIGVLLGLFINVFVAGFMWLYLWFRPTTAEITRDSVIINRKKFRRADFGGFFVDHTKKLPGRDEAIAVMAYHYGTRKYRFGGAWKESQATEVLAQLNQYLRSTPKTGDENNPSPEQLRAAAQPSDF